MNKATAPVIFSNLETWPSELRYRYEERAGIKEFDGNTPREQAEKEARFETWQEWLTEAFDPMSEPK